MGAFVTIGVVVLALAALGVYHFTREKSHDATLKALTASRTRSAPRSRASTSNIRTPRSRTG